MSDRELENLHRQIEDLQRQNHIFRLENKLSGMHRELSEYSATLPMSTPRVQNPRQPPPDPGKTRLDIPPGRPDDSRMADLDELDIPDEKHDFVTVRKKKTSPVNETKKVMIKPATFDGAVAWMTTKE